MNRWQKFAARIFGFDAVIAECERRCNAAVAGFEENFSPKALAESERRLQEMHNRALLELHAMYEQAKLAVTKIQNERWRERW
jgi:hypothetical protein